MTEEWVGIEAYAKHRNVTVTVVRRHIEDGKLFTEHKNGVRKLNVAEADKAWESHGLKGSDEGAKTTASSLQARTAFQTVKAQLAKLELDQKLGKLVPLEQVQNDAYKVANAVRNAMQNIPQKIAAEVAAETDPFVCEQIIRKEIDEALTELSRMTLAGEQ